MQKNGSGGMIVLGALIGAGLIGLGGLLGAAVKESRMADRYVTVKGLVEREVKSDLATWSLRFAATGNDLPAVYQKIEEDQAKVLTYLQGQGVAKEDVTIGQWGVVDLLAREYRSEGASNFRYIINASITVRSTNIETMANAGRDVSGLVKQGVVLSDNTGPVYAFTKLNDIKPEMIAEATTNARDAANKFAADSGSKVGTIRRANQGVFTIAPRDAVNTGGEYYDASTDTSIHKKVRVVTTVDYYLVQ